MPRYAAATRCWTTSCSRVLVRQVPTSRSPGAELQLETIVMRTGRPVLAVKRDEAQLTFEDPDSLVWTSRLTAARSHLVQAAKAVGRIEVEGHSLAWLGTGWLVGPETIVTNRHVAAEFGRGSGSTFVFRKGLDGQAMRASIDLLEEIDREDDLTFEIREILHIEDSGWPGCRLPARRSDRWRVSRDTDRPCAGVAAGRLRGRDRVPGTRQPDPRRRPDGPHLRRRVRQEATRAGPIARAGERHHASRLLDARRQLGIGRAVPRHRGGGRPALRRQVPPVQLRGLQQRRRAAPRRSAERASGATATIGRWRSRCARDGPDAEHRSIVGGRDVSPSPVDHGRDRRAAADGRRRDARPGSCRRRRRGPRLGRGRGVRRGRPGGLRRQRGIRRHVPRRGSRGTAAHGHARRGRCLDVRVRRSRRAGAEVRALLGAHEREPAAVPIQRRQHRRQPLQPASHEPAGAPIRASPRLPRSRRNATATRPSSREVT